MKMSGKFSRSMFRDRKALQDELLLAIVRSDPAEGELSEVEYSIIILMYTL